MYEAKTKPTKAGVTAFLGAIADPERRRDCRALSALMKRATGCRPRMWGTSIVGFDTYHYKYASGHEGDSCVVGYSPRKGDISIYLVPGYETAPVKALLAKLGKHKTGKACLYVRRLADVDTTVLEQLVSHSVAEIRRRYPPRGD